MERWVKVNLALSCDCVLRFSARENKHILNLKNLKGKEEVANITAPVSKKPQNAHIPQKVVVIKDLRCPNHDSRMSINR
jgi:hypothetical protein